MINWGIVGAGRIARVFCNALQFSKTGRLYAIASLSHNKANELADQFDCKKRYEAYDDLFLDNRVDAVYIATIHSAHLQPVIGALANGKHVLVEKPIATNFNDAATMIDAARKYNRFLMEGFMYRCHPQIAKLVELITVGVLGKINVVRSAFGFSEPFDSKSRTYDIASGGGGILDVGCYPVSMARLIAGAAAGKLFLDPFELTATGLIGPTGVDHYATAALKFENDITAEISSAVDREIPPTTVIQGSGGVLTVPEPWLPSSPCRLATSRLPANTKFPDSFLVLHKSDGSKVEIAIPADRDLFSYEADTVSEYLKQGQAPAMSWRDTLGNMQTLDRWLAEVNVKHKMS